MALKVSVGIPTYNDHLRVNNLLTSIILLTSKDIDYKIVCLDDGSTDKEKLNMLRETCKSFDVPLIEHKENKGIPTSWNDLTRYYDDAEIQVLFNDDIVINDSNWLKTLVYLFDNNDNIGSVGWNLVQIDIKTGLPLESHDKPNFDVPVGRVGSPVGCCFGFLRDHWKQIKQPDGSIGFYESLKSFYEETDFGFEQWKHDWMSVHVPYPAQEHWGSQTFSNNRELAVAPFNDMMSKSEYLSYSGQYSGELPIPLEKHKELADEGFAFRMDYSRMIFAKKWGCKDHWNTPQVEVHNEILGINDLPKRKIKYLDRDMKERECET